MASFDPDRQGGFATPAAMAACTALAVAASAGMLAATTRLRAARADYEKAQVEYALDGAQESAAVMLEGQASTPHEWSVGSPAGAIAVRAEPEEGKVAATVAAEALRTDVLAALGVEDVDALRGRLAALKPLRPSAMNLAQLDTAEGWRSCVRRLISPWGRAVSLRYESAAALGPEVPGLRAGQTWRVYAALQSWEDDRTLLLTGSAHPLLRARAFTRQAKGTIRCDELLGALSAATTATP